MSVFYITCTRLSLTPPVSGLRCIVFNKIMFCSVFFLWQLGIDEQFTVTAGTVQQIFLDRHIRTEGTRLDTKGILVTGKMQNLELHRRTLKTQKSKFGIFIHFTCINFIEFWQK